ncbi:MAG TPA: hypothetical protein VKU00_05975 [Chthonomonadaceae bacterium]|nr:hypothetical protein [Chthonomonadaceae bacterium]
MLHHIEPEETSPTGIQVGVAEPHSEILTQDNEQELAELTACVEQAGARITKRNKTIGRGILVVAAGLAVAGGAIAAATPILTSVLFLSISCPVLLIVGLMLLTLRMPWAANRNGRSLDVVVQRLTEMVDTRACAPLIDVFWMVSDNALRTEIWRALGRLLPQLNEEEVWALGKERQQFLMIWAQYWEHPQVRANYAEAGMQPLIGMLKVLMQGGQNAFEVGLHSPEAALLPPLEKWAAGESVGENPEVQEAARLYRAAILRRIALAKTGAHLLRASAPTPSGPDTLLRSVQNTAQADPQELLRPNTTELPDGPMPPSSLDPLDPDREMRVPPP